MRPQHSVFQVQTLITFGTCDLNVQSLNVQTQYSVPIFSSISSSIRISMCNSVRGFQLWGTQCTSKFPIWTSYTCPYRQEISTSFLTTNWLPIKMKLISDRHWLGQKKNATFISKCFQCFQIESSSCEVHSVRFIWWSSSSEVHLMEHVVWSTMFMDSLLDELPFRFRYRPHGHQV